MKNGAGRYVAQERGAFDEPEAGKPAETESANPVSVPACVIPVWQCARMDAGTVSYLADLVGCSVIDFSHRY